ncbi:MAG: hypothetical protein KJ063_09760 [Anaerolineae bacterium]|nr:hypothetical protein [Anaerolineae bacterium]
MSPFIWLGSKRAKKAGVGYKASLLDYAAKMGLPVPNGGILLHEFYLYALENGLVERDGSQLTHSSPSSIAETLSHSFRFPQLDKPVAVRAAFSPIPEVAAAPPLSFPGRFSVRSADFASFSNSLCEIWRAGEAHPHPLRRDLLIMEMIPGQMMGTAFSPANGQEDVIAAASPQTDAPPHTFTLPQLSRWKLPTAQEPFARRLQMLLRGVRRTFGPRNGVIDWSGDWEIKWIDDGRVCWLVRIRAVG